MKRRTANFVVVALLPFLNGCAVGPKYFRPRVQAPPTFRDLQPSTQASLAGSQWWQVFQDEQLQALIREAIQNNFDIRVAAIRVEEARAVARIDAAPLYPQVNVTGDIVKQKIAGIPAFTPASVGPQLSWEIDFWGRLRKERDAGRYALLASEEGQRFVLVELIAQVAQAYFALRELDLQLEISRNTVATRQRTMDLFDKLKKAGVNSGLDIAQAQADLAAARATIPDLERQIVQQEDALRFLIGTTPGPVTRGKILVEQYLPPEVPAGLPSSLLERRPDIRQAEANLRTANALVGVAKANFFPQISLTAFAGVASPQLAGLSQGTLGDVSAGGSLFAPVFQGGRLRGNYQLAQQQWQELKTDYEKSVQSSFREVADALIAYQKLRELRGVQEEQVTALERSVHLSTLRYSGGLSSYLDVLDAQRGLFVAQIQLAVTRGNQLFTLVELYRALGGGWQ